MNAVQEEGAEATKDEDVDSETQLLMRPQDTKRKSSISDALNKFTSQHFHRRRTTVDLTSSTSSADPLPPSRLPTPAGLSRSSSFFRNLSAFNSKPTNLLGKDKPAQSVTVKRSAAQPSACQGKASTPHPGHKQQNPSVEIPQHGLMQPIRPGVPRSSTLGNFGHPTSSPHTPSFMRPTSSSAARRQSQSSGFGLSTRNRQPRPARRSSLAQAVSKLYFEKESEREAKQQPKKPINPYEDAAFLLPPAKEADEEQIEYATDEEIEIGTARQMTITPVRSVSSHSPYSDTNFAYGLPDQHDKSKRDSGKPFEHLIARPVHLERHPPRRDSKPLPTLTPDPNQAPPHNVGHSQEMSQLTGRDSAEYYRRRNSKSLLRAISPISFGEEFKPEDVYFAEDIEDDDYEEEGEGDTVIHRVQGQLLKGSFASASTSEAASDDHDPRSEEGDKDLTTSTIKAFPREDDPQKASALFSSRPSRPFPSINTPLSAFCSLFPLLILPSPPP